MSNNSNMSNNKVVVVIGASSGIGALFAVELARRGGYDLVLAARRAAELQSVAEQVKSAAAHPDKLRILTVTMDATKRPEVQALVDRTLAELGRVDVVVNNVGLGISKSVQELTEEDVDTIINVNLKSALWGMQVVLPYFKQRGEGQIINISSFLGRVPAVPFRSIYGASKAALNMLTVNLRSELRHDYPNIHVTTVLPGIILTDFGKNAVGGTPQFADLPAPCKQFIQQFKPQTADAVAKVMADAVQHPVDEVYTNPDQAEFVKQFYQDIAAWEKRWE